MTSLLSISNCSVHLPIKDGTENFLYINISYIRTQTINIYDACICNYYILSPCWRYRINNNSCFTQVDGSVKLAVDSDSYWGNAVIGMYRGKRKVVFIIHRRTCSSALILVSCLTGRFLSEQNRTNLFSNSKGTQEIYIIYTVYYTNILAVK